MNFNVLQLQVKKRLLYGALVLIWITVPAFVTTVNAVATDIVKGMCIPLWMYGSDVAKMIISVSMLFVTYILPMMLMVFCYARIVYEIKRKVITLYNGFAPESRGARRRTHGTHVRPVNLDHNFIFY